jgi:hypothetical protein
MNRALTRWRAWGLTLLLPLTWHADGQDLKGVSDPTKPPPSAMRASVGASDAASASASAASAA